MARGAEQRIQAVPSDGPSYAYSSLEEAFPSADPNLIPAGSKVLVQIRTPKKKSAGGIILTDETQDTEMWNSQVGKVVAVGELAFKNRDTQKAWPEGAWCKVGDYVRVPKYGSDKWLVSMKSGEFAVFQTVRDLDIGGIVPDPLAVIAYI